MRHSRVTIAAVVVLLAGGLSACATEPPADADPTATVAPTPTTEPVGQTSPERLLDGDCDALYSDAEASAVVGAPVVQATTDYDLDPDYAAPEQLGGLDCRWSNWPDPNSAALSVIALPSAIVADQPEVTPECTPGYGCTFRSKAGEYTLYGVLYNQSASVEAATAAYEAVSAHFAEKAAGEPVPEPYIVDAAWPAEIDCATLDAGGLINAVAGGAGLGGEFGSDSEPNSGFYAALVPAGVTGCSWATADSESVGVTVLPGGAWMVDEVSSAAGAAPVEVEGADSAVAVGERLHVFAGDNWFAITAPGVDPAAFVPAAAELVAELDALS